MSRLRSKLGFTLVELMIAIAVLTMITTLVYSAFAGMKSSRDGVLRVTDRYREGRVAMSIIVRDLQSAFLSSNVPVNNIAPSRITAFISKSGTPIDRLDFATLAYRRLDTDVHESDQAEISYFGSKDPNSDAIDLVRRVDPMLDTDPEHGGRVEVLATDVGLLDLQYLDPLTGLWTEEWDTRQAIGVGFRLPHQVRVLLVLHDGQKKESGGAREDLRFITKFQLMIPQPLKFTADFNGGT